MHGEGGDIRVPHVNRLRDIVQGRLGRAVGKGRPGGKGLETAEGSQVRGDGHPLWAGGAVEQGPRGDKEGRGTKGVDVERPPGFLEVGVGELALLALHAGVGDDNVERVDAVGLELSDGLGGVGEGDALDLDEDEAGSLGGGDGAEIGGHGGGDVTEAADDGVVGAGEVRVEETTAEALRS